MSLSDASLQDLKRLLEGLYDAEVIKGIPDEEIEELGMFLLSIVANGLKVRRDARKVGRQIPVKPRDGVKPPRQLALPGLNESESGSNSGDVDELK